MIYVIVAVCLIVGAFVFGALAFRNNSVKANQVVDEAKNVVAKVESVVKK